MRILVFANLTPYVPGGAERQVRLLVEGWAREGHQVTVVGTRIPDTEIDVGGNTVRLCQARVWDGLGKPGRSVSYFLSLARALFRLRRQYDLIYCRFLADSACSVAFLKRLKLVRKPLVACPASSGPGGDAEFLKSFPLPNALLALLCAECDAINLISPGIAAEIRGLNLKPGMWSEIHNGVIQPPSPEQMPAPGPLRLIFVGGLRHQKAVDLLLDAVSDARRRGAVLALDLVGGGPDLEQLSAQAHRLRIDDITRFHGVLDSAGVTRRLHESHILVLPSRWEGMANVALEAMAIGRPVIVSRCGGVDRYVGPEYGWTFDIDDRAALTESILAAAGLSPGELESMGRACFGLIASEFSMKRAVDSHLELFDSLLAGR